MNFSVGITTAPRRADYLPRTLESLTAAGFDDIHVFPDERGHAHKHWRSSVRTLAESGNPVLICQDDVIFCKGIREYLERDLWPSSRVGCVSLYCSSYYPDGVDILKRTQTNIWGALALVIPNHVALEMIDHPKMKTWPWKRKIDICIGSTLQKMNREFWVYSPSLAQHIGAESSLTNSELAGKRMSSNFVGEDYDVSQRGYPDRALFDENGRRRR